MTHRTPCIELDDRQGLDACNDWDAALREFTCVNACAERGPAAAAGQRAAARERGGRAAGPALASVGHQGQLLKSQGALVRAAPQLPGAPAGARPIHPSHPLRQPPPAAAHPLLITSSRACSAHPHRCKASAGLGHSLVRLMGHPRHQNSNFKHLAYALQTAPAAGQQDRISSNRKHGLQNHDSCS